MTTSTPTPRPEWYADVPRSARGPTLYGFAALALSVAGFGIWGTAAPIAGAVIVSGVFVATGQNKTVQHLEGGVIREIAVSEGDTVEAGQLLVLLDETAPQAELRRLELRQARLAAIEARLHAETREAEGVTFPPAVVALASTDPDMDAILKAQQSAFQARRTNLKGEIATLRTGIDALQERVRGSQAQLKAVERQLGLIEEELEAKDQLLKQGLIRRSEVLALRRAQANLQGDIGRLTGDIGDSRERIARINEQIQAVRNASTKTGVDQMHEVHAELSDVRERMRGARRVLDRIRITAPVRGVVIRLRYHTAGGVIEPGKAILDIVPSREDLVIEARLRSQDIDNVRLGQAATIRLLALNQRVTPMISGRVIYVSADAVPDDKAGVGAGGRRDGYVVRVNLEAHGAEAVKGFEPTPGMPAEVYITTAERTFLEYLLKPLRDSMSRAFRET